MRRALFVSGFVLLIAFLGSAQQPTEIRVGIGWLALPNELIITGRERGATIRYCSGCQENRITRGIAFTAVGNTLQLTETATSHSFSEVSFEGDYELTLPGRPAFRGHFPGTLRADRDMIRVVLKVPLEEYVALALAGESADITSDAALQAMAVAVRTYALNQRGRHAKEGFDLCDATHCQLLRLEAEPAARLRAAAQATAGEIIWYRGEPAAAYYSGNCAGSAEDATRVWSALAAPYLRTHRDPYCLVHGRAEWTAEITKSDLARALREAGWANAGERVNELRIVERTSSGRAGRLEIQGAKQFTAGAEEFRSAVNRLPGGARLRSNAYDVRDAGDNFTFHGYGLGHGVGLCQAGAQEMGAEGKSYREILSFYYPGTAVGLTAQGLDWTTLHGERLDLLTTQPEADGALLPQAEKLLHAAELQTGWNLGARPELRAYPSVAIYRNATGEPGWVAASTKERVIRMQPPEVLRASGTLEQTLRHEFLHLLMESRAHAPLPLWFREGLVLYLEKEAGQAAAAAGAEKLDFASLDRALATPRTETEARNAYSQARRAVGQLVAAKGRNEVLGWVERGLPPDIFPQR